MDWFRTLLIVAIAVLGWNIIFQWNQDYGQSASLQDSIAPASQQNDLSTTDSDAAAQSSDSSEIKPPAINTDLIPREADLQTLSTDEKPLVEARGLVDVSTDVYQIQIDPLGGDIVHLALKKYPAAVEQQDTPFVMFFNGSRGRYLAESGIIGKSGVDLDASGATRPLFKVAKKQYSLKGDTLIVPMKFTNEAGITFEKRYIFNKGSYHVQIEYEVTNASDSTWVGRPYGRLRRTGFEDPSVSGGFGLPTFLGIAYWDPEERFTKIKFDDLEDEEAGNAYLNKSMSGGWIGVLQHYFVAAWTPPADTNNLYLAKYNEDASLPGGREYIADAVIPQMQVAPGQTETSTQSIYVGPKLQENLKEAAEGLHLAVDYGPLFFISDILMWILGLIYGVIGNYGFSIIILTIGVKIALFPLSAKGYRSMARMRDMQPKMAELKKKFGDDRQKMSQELMKLYQKEGINPLGGCLPMLLQMPVFLALYWALLESVELRQAPFILWIEDLSIMDPYFVLPLIMGVSMYFQQKLNPTPPDPMQAKVMKFMPIAMTFLFLFFPAGLVLYWVTNNILSIAQQAYITRNVSASSMPPKPKD